jgi:hypothetical protein
MPRWFSSGDFDTNGRYTALSTYELAGEKWLLREPEQRRNVNAVVQ